MKLYSLLWILSVSVVSAEWSVEDLVATLQGTPEAFERVRTPEGAAGADFQVKLGESVVTLETGEVFDGIRFTAPASMEGLDFVWAFSAPRSWMHWYILPLKGEAKPGFRNWVNPDRIYEYPDVPEEKESSSVLQSLKGDYFEPGAEYFLWFNRKQEAEAGVLRGRFRFVKSRENWEIDDLEKALDLKPAAAEVQVKALESKGGEILLDKTFFERGYAEGRIDDLFRTIRTTYRSRGGFFVTMQIRIPPCRSEPSLGEIVKKYGKPDFVRAVSEKQKAIGTEPEGEESEKIVIHYYDFFGFEVDAEDPEAKVLRVVTHAYSFAELRPKDEKPAFASVDMENLTVFQDQGKEVGRIYYFTEGGKEPQVIREPPPGSYRQHSEEMTYRGEGEWLMRRFGHDGTVVLEIPFVGHQMEGLGKMYSPDGALRYEANYRNGLVHGEVIEYAEDGTVVGTRHFEDGEQIEEPAK